MVPEVLVFMPNGDVTLTLIRNLYEEDPDEVAALPAASKPKKALSDVPQASTNDFSQPEPEDSTLDDILEDESLLFYAPEPPNAADGPFSPPSPRRVRGSDASSRRDRSSSPPASFWAALKRQQAARNNEAIEEEEEEEEAAAKPTPVKKERTIVATHEVHCVVSSRHMILASQVFENLLTGNSTEAKTLRATGQVKIPLIADLETVIILLNIIHGPSRKVPRQVTLHELSNLATLVSNFGMIETVQFFSDTWIDALQRDGLPKTYNGDVWRLLFVFWVFDRPDEFKNMTRLAQRECDENLVDDMEGVPIPHNIIDAIKREREYAIETAITIIHTLISRYMDGQTICDASLEEDMQYACDAMVLGSLMKSSRRIGLWPRPEAPFSGRKFKDLARAIRGIKILDVCNRSSRRFASLGTSGNCHGLEDELEASMKGIEAGLDGLELLQYAKKSDDLSPGLQMFVLAPEVEEVTPPVKENGVLESHAYAQEAVIPEYQKEEIKPFQQTISLPERRVPTPHVEIEEPIQGGVSLALHQPAQKSPYHRDTIDSRTSSRASDYQVQEPIVTQAKEEHKPYVSRTSPSQEWMNPGRVFSRASTDFEPVREQEEMRPQGVREMEELKPLTDRLSHRGSPISQVYRDEEKANGNGNGYGNGYGASNGNGNGISRPGYMSPRPNQVEDLPDLASRIQDTQQRSLHPETFYRPEKSSSEQGLERAPSHDRASYTSQTASHTSYTEKVLNEKRPEKISSNEGTAYISNVSQPERISYREKGTYPERTHSETSSSYAAKKSPPPPEFPVSQTQRTSYSVQQPSQSAKQSQPIQSAPRSEKLTSSYQERKSYNGNSSPSPSESFNQHQHQHQNQHHQQNAALSEVSIANSQIEKPSNSSSHQSYTKRPEISHPQQQKVVEREKQTPPPAQVEKQSQPSQHSYNGKSSHSNTVSQAQQQQQQQYRSPQTDKPTPLAEKSSYTSQTSINSRSSSQPEISHSPNPSHSQKHNSTSMHTLPSAPSPAHSSHSHSSSSKVSVPTQQQQQQQQQQPSKQKTPDVVPSTTTGGKEKVNTVNVVEKSPKVGTATTTATATGSGKGTGAGTGTGSTTGTGTATTAGTTAATTATAAPTTTTTTTLSEIDENWGQPQKFNMRKSKKKFSTRF